MSSVGSSFNSEMFLTSLTSRRFQCWNPSFSSLKYLNQFLLKLLIASSRFSSMELILCASINKSLIVSRHQLRQQFHRAERMNQQSLYGKNQAPSRPIKSKKHNSDSHQSLLRKHVTTSLEILKIVVYSGS